MCSELRLKQLPGAIPQGLEFVREGGMSLPRILVLCSGVSPSLSATVCSRSDTVSRSCSRGRGTEWLLFLGEDQAARGEECKGVRR